jgi:diguanylate cyclase (GGDEF)-like protein
MAVSVLVAQALVFEAAGLPGLATLALDGLVPAGTMYTLASIGGAELLLLMLLASAVEARMRGTLDKARFELQKHALRDELTGLPNRVSFEGTLAQAQMQADASHGQVVLLLVALDGLKFVNESFGHHVGDRVLRRMAQRLRGLAKPHALARLGSDEFLLLLDGEQAATQGPALAAMVLESIAQPCNADERELSLTCSIGLAFYPEHGSMTALIKHASVAMRTAKSAGGATYALFDARMAIDTRDQAELLRDLRVALERAQLELYYQPKIHAPSAQITGVEALLRWHHPQRGTISPNIFIPMAERSGLINALGAWVIDEACRQARAWRDQGLRMRVAVNLSAHQLRQPALPQHIRAALKRNQINPDLLTCEITESVAMEDTEATMHFFKELAAVGVHISIDDFGSGYSSLAYLRKLPAGELKIDRSFVMDLESSEEARKIAGAVVQLAQALNLKVVAEGVETNAQFQILRQLGCNELQGFLFAKPMSAKALAQWAIADEGPRTIQFRESLFQGTREMAL